MNEKLIKTGIRYGIIGGVLFLLINYGAWGLGSTANFVSAITVSSFVPYVMIMLIIAGFQLRKSNKGFLGFKEALKFAFVAYIVIALTEAIGNYVLYNFIDHNLTAKVFAVSKEQSLKMLQKLGATDEQVEKAMKDMDTDGKETGFKHVFLGFGYNLVWYFCKALLIALIVRKEEKFSD